MSTRFISVALAVSLCGLFAAGAPANAGTQVVTVTNETQVCVRFDAVGVEEVPPTHHGGAGQMGQPIMDGYTYRDAGPHETLTARAGETVRFTGLAATRARVGAHLFATVECTGEALPVHEPYSTKGPNEHIALRGHGFVHIAHL
ncbi:MAG TPA: hypothetical protein VMS32_07335 [Verrucomicrobiae bacterium]|jgi:hypothetical protein|nr:hypothetical protein [Verrucomicrobiae bacterium]